MKTIHSAIYKRLLAQNITDVDEAPNTFEENASLPVIREEDLADILEDDIEIGEDVVPEGAPVTQVVEETPEEEEIRRPEFTNFFDALEWAEDNNDVVQINYTTVNGNNLTREIEPHGSFYARTTHRTVLVTYDRTVGAIRAFIIRNINAIDFVGDKFRKKFIVSTR